MQPSPTMIAKLKTYEGFSLQAYLPTKDDVPTIGWGSTGPDIKLGMTWTPAQCAARFIADTSKFAIGVTSAIGDCPTTQNQFDAMFSLAYNIGLANFKTSSVLRYHKAGDYAKAKAAFALWNKQKGKVLNGLVNRRASEAAVYGS